MTTCKRGDLVLVAFVFADEKGVKKRPALVISSESYHDHRQEIVVAAVTSNIDRILPGDYVIRDWAAAGLPLPSVVSGIVRTIKREMVLRRIGALPSPERRAVDRHLRASLSL